MQVIMTPQDQLLDRIDRARRGDRDAFDAILSEYSDRLESFAFKEPSANDIPRVGKHKYLR